MSRPRSGRLVWLRWSVRDLRRHWVSVIAIALVLSIGIGVYAGLGSTSQWRRQSNDESFAATNMHDLRVALSPGTFVNQGVLDSVVRSIDQAPEIVASRERLVVDTQIDADTPAGAILVMGRMVGSDFDSVQGVDDLWVRDGSAPSSTARTSVLEAKFADFHDLEPRGVIAIGGGRELEYAGLGVAPEEFFHAGPEGSILSQGDLGFVYTPLAVAQEAAGRPGQVNDVVLTIDGSVDRDVVEAELRAVLQLANVGASVTTRDDAESFRVLYDDIDNDQRFWNAISALVLVAAALAAFNLVSRIVEAQRREIGIGMALGVPPGKLALRPLLVGAEVAILGTLAGVGVGLLVGMAMGNLLESFLPLPVHRTPFQMSVFGRAALLGLAVPIVASAVPVWRAVRVEPIEAIRTGHLAARSSRFVDWTRRVRLPGRSLTQMPLRNILRTPRRTIVTAVGVGAAIASLVAVLGMLDSFVRTVDTGGAELTKGNVDRILVQLDTFHDEDSATVRDLESQPTIASIDAGLRLPVTVFVEDRRADDLDLLLELVDLDAAAWTPTVVSGTLPEDGVLLAAKAVDDLGVAIGDSVTVRHPQRSAAGQFTIAETTVRVAGIHANPLRSFAFMDLGSADVFGLAGSVNVVNAYPQAGTGRLEVQRAVVAVPGVTSSQAVAGIEEGFDELMEQFSSFLVITAAFVLILALLIAFNATRIAVDERRREHATMGAFGVPLRSVMGTVVKESVIIGVLSTILGVAAGTVFLDWMIDSLAASTMPDLGIERYISSDTLALAALVGIVAVALAPLFLVRSVARLEIPDALRVME